MAISVDHFAGQIVDSGVLSAEEVSVCRAASSAQDAEQFARELVKQKKLTAFQAQQLYSGKGKTLVLGNYVVLDKLGQGGMGMVLKARHRRMDRLVALKVLSPTVVKTPDLLARFHREVKAAARLEHPNIVAAYDADEARGTHFFVMQYVEGSDLASVVKKKGPLPVDQAVNCLLQAARGLDYAHRNGVIHRDIKPANLLLDNHGTVKILDMGLARIEGETGAQAELTSTGAVMGTVDYMAPEQALSTKSADAKSDIYSLGITLWYLLVGRPAYEGDSLMARLLAHRESPVPSLKGARAEIPAALDALFRKMVAKSPKDRCQSMAEVVAALDTCLKGDIGGEGNAPSITGGPTEDSKLSNFLGIFGDGTDPMAVTAATPKVNSTSAAGHPTPGSEFEATVTNATAAEGTDPATLTNLARSTQQPLRTRPPFSWRSPRTIAAATGVLALLLGAVMLWPDRKPLPPVPASPAPPGVAQVDPPGTGPGRVSAAVPVSSTLPADGDPTAAKLAGSPSALEFDGVDDYVDLTAARLEGKPPITVEAFVTPARVDRRQTVFRTDKLPSVALSIQPDGAWRFAGFDQQTKWFVASAPGLASPGKRAHVAATWDSQGVALYVDGRRVGSPGEQPISEKELPLTLLGGKTLGNDQSVDEPFAGRISGLRISSSVRYRGDFPRPTELASDPETVALYRFEDGTGEVLTDSSGRKLHGKIIGASWVRPSIPPSKSDDKASRPRSGLDFNVRLAKGNARVAIPAIQDNHLPCTVEMFVTPRSAPDSPKQNRLVLSVSGALVVAHRKDGWRWHGPDPEDRVTADAVLNRRTHLAAVSTGGELRLYVDGKQAGRAPLTKPIEPTRFGTLVGGHAEPMTTWEPLDAVIDELRVSTTARYDGDFPVPDRLTADQNTRALYQFDEGQGDQLRDTSGSGNHARIVGAKWVGGTLSPETGLATPMAAAPAGGADNALLIDSTTLGITVVPYMKYDGSHPLTIEAWVKPATVEASRLPNSGEGHAIMHPLLDVKFSFKDRRWSLSSSTDKTKFFMSKQTAAHVEKGGLTHVAGVLADGKLKLFLDGKLQFTEELDGALPADIVNSTFFIGDGPEAGGRRFHGIIDEVRFSRVARYESDFVPQRRFVPDANTLALYHFDEEDGAAVADSSPRNRPLWMVDRVQDPMPKRVRADGSPIPRSPEGRFALDLDGEADFIEAPDVPLDLARPYTVELWVMPTLKRGGTVSFFRRGPRVSQMWRGSMFDGWMTLASSEGGQGPAVSEDTGITTLDPGQPQHVAFVCDPVTRSTRVFFNGVLMSSIKKDTTIKETMVDGGPLVIGKMPDVAGARDFFQGRLYGYRLSQGKKYATTFLPVWELPAEEDTLVLYRCGEGSGDLLKDSSGHNRHGKISGGAWVHVDDRPSLMVPLRSLAHPVRNAVNGNWTVVGTTLKSDASLMCVIEIPYHPPAEYDIELEFTREANTGVLAPMLTKGDRRFHYEFGGWGGTFFGFGLVDGMKVKDSPTALIRDPLENGRRYTGRIQIRNGVARAWLDGELLSELKTDYSNLNLETAVELPDPLALGLSTTSEFSIHSAKLWPIGPETERFDRDHAPPAKDYALQYVAAGGVEVKSLHWDGSLPLTIEARVDSAFPHSYPMIIARLLGKGACQVQWEPGNWAINISDGSGPSTWILRAPMRSKTGPWDVAWVIDRDAIRVFENGKLILDHQGWPSDFTKQFEPQLCMGGHDNKGNWSYDFIGSVDEIRLSKTARYKTDYNRQHRLTADKETLALYHFDEGTGDIAHDSSGNGHDGKILQRAWKRVETPGAGLKVGLDGMIDPLAELDPATWNYRPDMTWTREGTVVVGNGTGKSEKSDWFGFGFPVGVPGDYDVEVDLRQRGIWPMQIDFPLHDRAIRVDLSPDGSGLFNIDGKDGGGPPYRHKSVKLESDKLHKFVGRVRFRGEDISVEATLDGQLIGKYEGARSRVSLPPWVKPDLKDIKITGLADFRNVRIELHRARVRPLPAEPVR